MQVKCTDCKGKGWYRSNRNSKREWNEIKCEVCNGDGIVLFNADKYSFNKLAFSFRY